MPTYRLLNLCLVIKVVYSSVPQECIEFPKIYDYDRTTSVSERGYTCQRWDSQSPHPHNYTDPVMFPDDATLSDAANYCRNPDGSEWPWCYVDNGQIWDFCSKDALHTGGNRDWSGAYEYTGQLTVTKSGFHCVRWDADTGRHGFPHDSQYADGSVSAAANYCRNPNDATPWPWCPPVERSMWEYCDFETLVCRRDDNFVVSLSCRDSLAQSGNYAACSDVNLTNRRPLCELRTARDVQTLKSVAKTSGALLMEENGVAYPLICAPLSRTLYYCVEKSPAPGQGPGILSGCPFYLAL